jgi:hypothetical protein
MNYSHFVASFNRFSGIDSEYANECDLADLMGEDDASPDFSDLDADPIPKNDPGSRAPWISGRA